ncbi:cytochrome ubiquinol oxidase subunit I [Vreelandella nanhaiensis]|uniref:Cytochrome ubiquinol oxidase subunit I n=1 Tax=Vreelandella nanhaiensis TaxID=1258546 RepID=A0A433KLC0_9GAMM|nr:cytochrome ubiquinol oxidase subunit I [Halomonas nanhaiensis]RUR30467.1 cytochrome ubiquinol oxidase subunit I [Halomonas nanhaiensis]
MELDPLVLSRIQFAFVVSFHAIFPVFTIGLASYIALLQGLFFKTQNPAWDRLALFWTKVFAVVFGMGVVSGVVMSFQFGTNWSNFSLAASNFIGPVLSYEVVTAFFLEAAFLGILLFGRGKVPQGIHLMAATIVAIGTFISAFWILSANSWMHTPAGVELIDNRFHVTSWREAIFNPSFPYRFSHMAIASFITGGFVVAGVSSWFLLRGRDPEANRRALSMCLWLLLFLTPLQAVVGDFHGVNTLEYQPTKVAAIEGHWETATNVPLLLFALPDQEAQENRFAVGIPNLASLILTHSIDGEIPGISEAPPEEQPPVMIVFWAFRVMVGIGLLMIATAFTGLILRRKGRIYESRLFLKTLVGMISLPFIAVLAGWIVTESGRAPWLVYGIMSHADGITPSLTGWMALFTLIGYVLVYAVIFYAGVYYLTRVVRNGMLPEHEHASVDRDADRPKRPLSAAHTPFDDDVDPVRS